MIKQVFICIILLFFTFLAASAQDDNCEATLDKTTVNINEGVILSIVFYGAEDMPVPQLPEIAGFSSRYINSLNIVVKRGETAVKAIKHRYMLTPTEAGNFTIKPMAFEFEGQFFKTGPLNIEVVSTSSIQKEAAAQAPLEKAAPGVPEERAFIVLNAQKNDIYLNQQIKIQVRFYVNKKTISLTDVEYPMLEHSNFSMGEFPQPRREQETLKENYYEVLVFENIIFPTKVGKLELGPAKIKCKVLTKRETQPINRASGAISDSEDEYTKTPMEFTSPAITINVKDFPRENRPLGFQGAVGKFSLDAGATPLELTVGNIITLTMKISGPGNLNVVTAPSFSADDFKIYQPEVEISRDAKVFKQTLIPQKSGTFTITKIAFSFFDPEAENYQEITKEPLQIKVFEAQKPSTEAAALEATSPGKTAQPYSLKEDLGKDIVYIKDSPGAIKEKGVYLFNNKLFVAAQLSPLFVYLGIFFIQKRKRHLRADIRYARYISAFKRARKTLKKAKALINKDKPDQFYALIFKTLQDYLGDKFYMPAGGITIKDIEKIVQGAKLHEETLRLLMQCFIDYDRAMFIPSELRRPEEMIKLFKNVSDAIGSIERQK